LIEASYIATRSLVGHVQWIQPEDAAIICQPLVHRGQSMPSACLGHRKTIALERSKLAEHFLYIPAFIYIVACGDEVRGGS